MLHKVKSLLLIGFIILATFICSSEVFSVDPQLKPNTTIQVKKPEIHAIQYVPIDHGDVVLMPAKIDIKYGSVSLSLLQGATGALSIPEGSPLINPDGSVKTTVTYTLKNNTSKNFKFNILLVFGTTAIASKEIILLSNQTKNVLWNINFPPTPPNEPPRNLWLRGPVGTSDDTPISFFTAKLRVHVYPL